MTAALMTRDEMSAATEIALIDGDLSKFSPEQRVVYYNKVCESLGLNPLTKPFAYIRLNGKLVLYALKDCTEQLRKRDGVSIYELKTQMIDGVYVVTAYARSRDGKEDVATGAVPMQGLKGEAMANALMKAETKSKRRVTLSICGLGMTDESEVESIPGAQQIRINQETGEIELPAPVLTLAHSKSDEEVMAEVASHREELANAIATAKDMDDLKHAYIKAAVAHANRLDLFKDLTDLKDLRKKQIQEFKDAIVNGTFDDPVPVLNAAPTFNDLESDIPQ